MKVFLNLELKPSQDIISILGPSGTGKSFCANFLKNFGYEIVTQITTRNPRPDDMHYTYVSHKAFVDCLKNNEILGYYSGSMENLSGGNGYGYEIKYLQKLLQNPNAKLILFPSAYELNTPSFKLNYGNTTKIALTFADSNSVTKRANYAGKSFSNDELLTRINIVKDLTNEMQMYNQTNDTNFHLIFSDSFGENRKLSERMQLIKVCEAIGINKNEIMMHIKNWENSYENMLST